MPLKISMLLNLQIAFCLCIKISALAIVDKLLKLFYLSVIEHHPDFFSPLCPSTLCYNSAFCPLFKSYNLSVYSTLAHHTSGWSYVHGWLDVFILHTNLSLQNTSSFHVTYHDERSHQKSKPLNCPNWNYPYTKEGYIYLTMYTELTLSQEGHFTHLTIAPQLKTNPAPPIHQSWLLLPPLHSLW